MEGSGRDGEVEGSGESEVKEGFRGGTGKSGSDGAKVRE